MIKMHLSSADLEHMQFAYSPLLELTNSYALLKAPQRWAFHRSWVDDALQAASDLELTYLSAMFTPGCYIVDFITPTPDLSNAGIEDEFQRLRNLSPDVIRADIERMQLYNDTNPILQQFLVYPHEMIECLIEDMRVYWANVLEPRWPSLQTLLENDVLYHARELALHGTERMFEGLSERVAYQGGTLNLRKDKPIKHLPSREIQLQGEGLYLTPSAFSSPSCLAWQYAPYWDPMIIYGARGAGAWYTPKLPDPIEELEQAIGGARAQVLLALREPENTVALARALHLTESAVSQHLKRLTSAGLVESRRSGHRVYYRLSERGSKLISLFAPD